MTREQDLKSGTVDIGKVVALVFLGGAVFTFLLSLYFSLRADAAGGLLSFLEAITYTGMLMATSAALLGAAILTWVIRGSVRAWKRAGHEDPEQARQRARIDEGQDR